MARAGRGNWQVVAALVLAVPIALLIVATFSPFRNTQTEEPVPEPPPPRPKAKAKAPPAKPKAEPPAPAKPPEVAPPPPPDDEPREVAPPPRPVPSSREAAVAKNELAHRGCRTISDALAAYMNSAANPGKTRAERLPQSALDLIEPPFGGKSFLPNGKADLIDPWGKSYQFMPGITRKGDPFITVFTYSPDAEHITQFGIGQNSYPPY